MKPWNHQFYDSLQRQVNSQPSAHFDSTFVIDLAGLIWILALWPSNQDLIGSLSVKSRRILVKSEVGSCSIGFLDFFQLEVCSKKAASRKPWNYFDAVTQGSRTPLAFPAAWLPLWMDRNKGAKQLASCTLFEAFDNLCSTSCRCRCRCSMIHSSPP